MATAVLLGVLLSQPGHALGYVVLFGSRSFAMQSHGAHAYFPTTFHLSFELLTTVALAVAAILGLGRLALGRSLGLQAGPCADPRDLILVLGAVQLNVFAFQELTEVLAAGLSADTHWLAMTALGAIAGQLPVAVVGGLLLAWCSTRLRVALDALRRADVALVATPNLSPAAVTGRGRPKPIEAAVVRAPIRKRGPPRSWSPTL